MASAENGSSDTPPTTTTTATEQEIPQSTELAVATVAPAAVSAEDRWPGWPGDCVFRLIVPVLKVGSIIGRKGDLIKKLCEETRARVRVLDGPLSSHDRIVLVSGKEEPDVALSPAMDAILRISKRINGLPESEEDAKATGAPAVAFCSVKLLVAASQAINLIGKQGSTIKSIQDVTGASVKILSSDDPTYGHPEERIVEVQGEALKVLKALEAVVGHLRKFLVDHTVLPLFEKNYTSMVSQDCHVETLADKPMLSAASQNGIGSNYSRSFKRESIYLDCKSNLDMYLPSSGLSLYGQDTGLPGMHSSGRGHAGGPIVTQIAQTMQIPLAYAEDIIGVGGSNIAYIRRTSGAILSVEESVGLPDEIVVEIKGTSSQVQAAELLIQECVNSHKEIARSSYGKFEPDSGSSYSQLGNSSYPSSYGGGQRYDQQYEQQYGRYGSSTLGYGTYRI